MTTQTCTKCGIDKNKSNFYKGNNKNGLTYKCKYCYKKAKEDFNKNNPNYFKEYASKNKDRVSKHKKKYYINNIEKHNEAVKKYSKSEKGKVTKAKRQKIRIKTDYMFQLKKNLRTRIWSFFKKNKTKGTETLLGCTFEEAKQHIENQFVDNMTWENYGEWHIDHKIPLSSAGNLKEAEKLCYYTNLQALWAIDNILKSDSI